MNDFAVTVVEASRRICRSLVAIPTRMQIGMAAARHFSALGKARIPARSSSPPWYARGRRAAWSLRLECGVGARGS
jgi:hypothetical protein